MIQRPNLIGYGLRKRNEKYLYHNVVILFTVQPASLCGMENKSFKGSILKVFKSNA